MSTKSSLPNGSINVFFLKMHPSMTALNTVLLAPVSMTKALLFPFANALRTEESSNYNAGTSNVSKNNVISDFLWSLIRFILV